MEYVEDRALKIGVASQPIVWWQEQGFNAKALIGNIDGRAGKAWRVPSHVQQSQLELRLQGRFAEPSLQLIGRDPGLL